MEHIIFWVILGSISLLGFLVSLMGVEHLIVSYMLMLISIVILARFFTTLARKRIVTVDLLMGVAGLVTWYIGAILEGFIVYVLYSISELIEFYAERYAKKKLVGLKELLPSKVPVLRNGLISEEPLEEVKVGDVVLIRPGSAIPADSIIIEGESAFDASYITGESELKALKRGDYVESGYVNKGELIKIRVIRSPKESLLQVLVSEAEKALAKKSKVQKFIEKFSQPYTLIVLGLFTLAALTLSPYRALAILLAGCPSAFIVSSATSTALSIAILARKSIVVHGGVVLEKTAESEVLVLDKMGTITLGELKVVRIMTNSKFTRDEVAKLAGGAAKASNHPVAKALAKLSDTVPSKAIEFPGKGVEAIVNGARVLIGSREFFKGKGINMKADVKCDMGEREVLVSVNGEFAGAICLGEKLSSEIRDVVSELRKLKLKLIIASGDIEDRVRKVAEFLGLKEYYANMKPHEKKLLIEMLKEKHKCVAMVGDGINDVEALAEADVGIAVGDLSVVSSVADIVLPKGILKLPEVFKTARKYVSSIYVSLATALVVKMSVMVAGLMGLLPLCVIVGIGDDGSTLIALATIGAILFRKS